MSKKVIRQQMRHILKTLPAEEKKRQSAIITEKLLKHAKFAAAERISIYVNTVDEVATTRILHHCWQNGKTCFIPKYDPSSYEMQMVQLRSAEEFDSLPLTSWNMRQPAMEQLQADALDSGGLHLIIVPGLAFTQSGHRLGSGRGYYDRYFQKALSCSSLPFLIGLAFDQQILPLLPTERFDVTLDQVITSSSPDD